MSLFDADSNVIVAHLADNSVFVLANSDGAHLIIKIDSASAEEIGFILGSAEMSLKRQIGMYRDYFNRTAGGGGLGMMERGLNLGREKMPHFECMGMREARKPDPKDE